MIVKSSIYINKSKIMRFIQSLIFLCCVQGAVCAQSPESVAKIDSIRSKMQQLARANQLHAVSGFYANNAIVRGPDAMLNGKMEIEKYWQEIRGAGEDWHWDIQCVSGTDQLIYQTGKSHLTLRYGDFSKTYTVHFCVAWERQADGSYKIIADIYH